MPDAFEIETRNGIRKVEFDPDAFRFRDVRILVDGERVAEMPYPKPASPYHETTFELDGHQLVGMAHLTAIPDSVELMGLHYDLFANGRSLTDGRSLAEARKAAPGPGEAYPGSFKVIDMVVRITPAASAPGLGIAVTRRGSDLGWSWVTVIGLLALMLGAVVLATWFASRAWASIRRDQTRSVRGRTAIGLAAVIGCYAAAFAGVFGLAFIIGQASQ